jgi:integrase
MHPTFTWNLDLTRMLTRRELATVLADLHMLAPRSAFARRNLVVVRLPCCCGLCVTEIANLQMGDVVVSVTRPYQRLRTGTTKGAGHGGSRSFLSSCKVLGLDRLRTLTIHHGRHTFISHALIGPGRRRARQRAGTSVYLHVAVEDDGGVERLIAFD